MTTSTTPVFTEHDEYSSIVDYAIFEATSQGFGAPGIQVTVPLNFVQNSGQDRPYSPMRETTTTVIVSSTVPAAYTRGMVWLDMRSYSSTYKMFLVSVTAFPAAASWYPLPTASAVCQPVLLGLSQGDYTVGAVSTALGVGGGLITVPGAANQLLGSDGLGGFYNVPDGTVGQVLTRTVTGPTWQNFAGGGSGGIAPVTSFPSSPVTDESVFFPSTGEFYTWNGTAWVLQATAVRNASQATMLSLVGSPGQLIANTTDGKLYRWVAGTGWTAAVASADISGNIAGSIITASTITGVQLAAGAVTAAKTSIAAINASTGALAANAVTSAALAANAVTSVALAANAVTAAKTAIAAIDSGTGNLTANSVTAVNIVAGTITGVKIQAGEIAASHLAANSVVAGKILAGTITSTDIAANTITGANIFAGSIGATEIAAGAITASKLNVTVGSGNMISNSSFEQLAPASAVRPLYFQEYNAAAISTTYLRSTGRVAGTFAFGLQANASTSSAFGMMTTSSVDSATGIGGVDRGWSANQTYQVSFYAKKVGGAAWTVPDLQWTVAPTAETLTIGGNLTTSFQRYVFAVTWGASIEPLGALRIAVVGNTVNGDQIIIDDLQVESGDVVTMYAPKANDLLPGTIVANMLAAGSVTATAIAADSVGASAIIANSITAAKIQAGTITSTQIAANSITADRIDSRNLTIKDAAGNVILSAGTMLDASNIAASSAWQNSNIYTDVAGRVRGIGFTLQIDDPLNLLDYDPTWVVAATGVPTGWTSAHSIASESSVISVPDGPKGIPQCVVRAVKSGVDVTNSDGGFAASPTIVPASGLRYRVVFPVRRVTASAVTGTIYFGVGPSFVTPNIRMFNADGTTLNDNAYFVNTSAGTFAVNEWYLCVGYVYPFGGGAATANDGGLYRVSTGEKVITGLSFVATTNGNTLGWNIRAFQNGVSTAGQEFQFSFPFIHACDGTEPAIFDMFKMVDIRSLGYLGDLSATNDLQLDGSTGVSIKGNGVTKLASTSAWDQAFWSRNSFKDGAYVTFTAASTAKALMVGLNSDPLTDVTFTSLDFAWYLLNTGMCEARKDGVALASQTAYALGDVFTIQYDGAKVLFLKNNTVVVTQTTGVTAGATLFLDSSLFDTGAEVTGLRFGPLSNNNWTNLGNIPYGSISNVDDATAMGFNPSFSDWPVGQTLPTGYASQSGSAPTRETSIVRVGTSSVRFAGCVGTDRYFAHTILFANPMPAKAFLSGSFEAYVVSRTSGCPGILVDLIRDAGGTLYDRTPFPVLNPATTGSWQRTPWVARTVTGGAQIYGIRIYIMGSYSLMTGGAFTGDVIFDNLTFTVMDGSLDNKTITIDSGGNLLGGGGGTVSITGLGYTGALNATYGAPTGTTVGGTLAETVAGNAANGATAFTGTANYRTAGAPSTLPSPTAVTVTNNTNGTCNIRLDWAAYTQGTLKADLLMLFWSKTGVAPTINDSSIAFNVNSGASYYIFEGVNPADTYSFGIAAARRTEIGFEFGAIQAPTTTPDWLGVTGGTPNFTANVGGAAAATVVANASAGNTAATGTVNYRNSSAPTNNGSFGAITQVQTADGNIVVTVPYTYTQGALPADQLFLFYREAGGTVVATNDAFATNAVSGTANFTLKPATIYSFGIQAVRRAEAGLLGTAIVSSGNITTLSSNYTGTVNGVAVAVVTTAVSNFNGSNDRNATAITAPTISADALAVDHTVQTDGSVDISLEWSWAGAEGDIDGFQVIVYQAATNAAYVFGTTASAEQVFNVPASKRAFILFGTAADKFYKFGVLAYRAVDKDINAAGIIKSTLVSPSLAAENPYQPSTTVAFSGSITGTINGITAANVNVWSSISGAGKPEDGATVGAPTGTFVGGTAAATVVANASAGNTAATGTAAYRNNVAPTNNAAFGTITQSQTADGNIVVTVPYTYTQGAVLADQIYIFMNEGGGTVTVADPAMATNAASGQMNFTLKPTTTYSFGLQAVRRTESGLLGTAILTSSNVVTQSSNFMGTVNGIPAISVNDWSALTGNRPIQYSAMSKGNSATQFPTGISLGVRNLDAALMVSAVTRSYALTRFNRISGALLQAESYDVYAGQTAGNIRYGNLYLQSENPSIAPWTSDSPVTTRTLTAGIVLPDGSTGSVYKVTEATTSGANTLYQPYTGVAGQYVVYYDVKAAERSIVRVSMGTATLAVGADAYFNLTTGVIAVAAAAYGGATSPTATITALGNGWYRCAVGCNFAAGSTFYGALFLRTAATSALYVGTAGSGVYLLRAQLAPGLLPRTYRSTTTVIRYLGAQELADDLNSFGPDDFLVLTTTDEPSANRLTGGLPAAIYRCGGSPAIFGSPNFKIRSAYILIGVPGCGEGQGFEAYKGDVDNDTSAWCAATFSFQNGLWNISGTGATPGSVTDYGYTGDLNATFGATWGSNVTGIPYETIFNNDDSVALGFNPTLSWKTGSFPAGWSVWAGAAPVKETVLVRVGTEAVKYVCTGADVGMLHLTTFTATPLPVGTFLAGSFDAYLSAYTSGKPGLLVRLWTSAAIASPNYVDTKVPLPATGLGSWQRVPWTARVPAGIQIYGIQVYVMGSWTAMTGGSFTGTVVFDNLRFMLADNTTDNTVLTPLITAAQDAADAAGLAASAAASAASTAQTAANTANSAIANIASDNILSPGDKPTAVQNYNQIIAEQAGIDAQATSYAITTQKTTYDAAITALTAYLVGLTGWNAIPGSDVVIVGTTFRQKFQDVYAARQALLNAILAAAKALANTAQTTADGKLSKSASDVLSGTISINATTGAGFRAGTLTWDATGARLSGVGVAMTPGGLVAYNAAGTNTFSLNAATGDATFAGNLNAASITAGSLNIARLPSSDLQNLCWNGNGVNLDGWNSGSPAVTAAATGWLGVWGAAGLPNDSALTFANRDNTFGNAFTVREGDTLFCEMDTMSKGAIASVYSFSIGVQLRDRTGALISGLAGATRAAGTTGHYLASGSVSVPYGSGAVTAIVWIQINGPGATTYTADGVVHHATNLRVRRTATAVSETSVAQGSTNGQSIKFVTSANRAGYTELITANSPLPGSETLYTGTWTVPAVGLNVFASLTVYSWIGTPVGLSVRKVSLQKLVAGVPDGNERIIHPANDTTGAPAPYFFGMYNSPYWDLVEGGYTDRANVDFEIGGSQPNSVDDPVTGGPLKFWKGTTADGIAYGSAATLVQPGETYRWSMSVNGTNGFLNGASAASGLYIRMAYTSGGVYPLSAGRIARTTPTTALASVTPASSVSIVLAGVFTVAVKSNTVPAGANGAMGFFDFTWFELVAMRRDLGASGPRVTLFNGPTLVPGRVRRGAPTSAYMSTEIPISAVLRNSVGAELIKAGKPIDFYAVGFITARDSTGAPMTIAANSIPGAYDLTGGFGIQLSIVENTL